MRLCPLITSMSSLDLPIRAATETAQRHGIQPDRCDILQNASTLVLRLTENLVARVVADVDGPRKGTEWFARENAIAAHLTRHGAPAIPLHPALPPGPHEHLGYTLNFWQFVTITEDPPANEAVGRTLYQCHAILSSFAEPLPSLAIVRESIDLLQTLRDKSLLPAPTIEMLRAHLEEALQVLGHHSQQALHGDSHPGNLLNTTGGLLWTDWEDAFAGPVEWDVASFIWNPLLLDNDVSTANQIVAAYCKAGGLLNLEAMNQCLIARAAVITAWYPVLYPNPNPDRQNKLQRRIQWLENLSSHRSTDFGLILP